VTVQDILSPILRRLGYEQADVDADAALRYDLIECVNAALQTLVAYGDWEFLFPRETIITIANVETVDLPADFAAMAPADNPYFSPSTAGMLRAAAGDEMSSLRLSGGAAGRPVRYQPMWSAVARLWQLSLWPIPNAAYSIVIPYVRKIAPLTELDQSPPIPDELHQTLRTGTMAEAEDTFGANAISREKFAAQLAADWARYGSPHRGQRTGTLSKFGTDEDDLPFDFNQSDAIEVIRP
jgi:hypothetical protein